MRWPELVWPGTSGYDYRIVEGHGCTGPDLATPNPLNPRLLVGASGEMAEIFISYASVDRPLVAALAQQLADVGYSVWWDAALVAGTNFRQTIRQELAAARCAVVLWTSNSVISLWVLDEADEALKVNKLVPIIDDHLSPDAIPYGFRSLHAVRLADTNGILAAISGKGLGKKLETSRPQENEGSLLSLIKSGDRSSALYVIAKLRELYTKNDIAGAIDAFSDLIAAFSAEEVFQIFGDLPPDLQRRLLKKLSPTMQDEILKRSFDATSNLLQNKPTLRLRMLHAKSRIQSGDQACIREIVADITGRANSDDWSDSAPSLEREEILAAVYVMFTYVPQNARYDLLHRIPVCVLDDFIGGILAVTKNATMHNADGPVRTLYDGVRDLEENAIELMVRFIEEAHQSEELRRSDAVKLNAFLAILGACGAQSFRTVLLRLARKSGDEVMSRLMSNHSASKPPWFMSKS